MSTSNEYQAIDDYLAKLELVLIARHVPSSTFKGEEWREKAINFSIVLSTPRGILYQGPYAYGYGLLKKGERMPDGTKWPANNNSIMTQSYYTNARERGVWLGKPVPTPNIRDVMYSALMDSAAIDCANFEEWAADYGYDPDSRAAEKIYNTCLAIGLQLRATLGDDTLVKLHELFQDY